MPFAPPTANALTGPSLDVSIIVPALNEAKNLPELARRVDAAMKSIHREGHGHASAAGKENDSTIEPGEDAVVNGLTYELLVVDDNSPDGTPAVCAELARSYPLRLHVRPKPEEGLSGAVLEGFALACGRTLVVMDADLQHPPEKLPELIAAVGSRNADAGGGEFALGSRYIPGGSTAEKWSIPRRINSWIATLLARPFAGATRDPMSGFFALPRSVFERGEYLTPLGYKIGLELMCKCRVAAVKEVPIHFDTRSAGESKLSLKQQFKYLEHLSRLYDFCYPRVSPIVKFILATGLGWLVGFAAYVLLLNLNAAPQVAIPGAYLATIATTLVFHFRYVRTQRKFLITRSPWRDFVIVALGELIACTLANSYLLSRQWNIHTVELFVLTFSAATVARYALRKELMQDIRGLRKEKGRE